MEWVVAVVNLCEGDADADNSGSVGSARGTVLDFARALVAYFVLSPTDAQIGYVEFETTAYTLSALTPDLGVISAAIDNARAFLDVQAEHGSFDHYIWQFVNGRTKQNQWMDLTQIPTETAQSQTMSKDLKQRGFRFVGPTICYAFMQATGMVNDHVASCFRHLPLARANH